MLLSYGNPIPQYRTIQRREIYSLLLCRTQLGNIHTLYPWIGTSYNSSRRDRRGICSGIIIIRMVPIRQYIIHRTRHTILIVTSSQVVVCHMTQSYIIISTITQLYIYDWKNSIGMILVGMDGHQHDNI